MEHRRNIAKALVRQSYFAAYFVLQSLQIFDIYASAKQRSSESLNVVSDMATFAWYKVLALSGGNEKNDFIAIIEPSNRK